MTLVRLTRRYRFPASHRLHTPLLSPAANQAVYGKCNNPFGHGHDYVLDVTLAGPPPASGRLLPLSQLDHFIHAAILPGIACANLNIQAPEFAALVPTTENLAAVLAARIAAAWPAAFPHAAARFEKLRIWETPNNIFEVRAPLAHPRNSSHEIEQSQSHHPETETGAGRHRLAHSGNPPRTR